MRGFVPAGMGAENRQCRDGRFFLANTDALIIDVRKNGGRAIHKLVALIASYLFDNQPCTSERFL